MVATSLRATQSSPPEGAGRKLDAQVPRPRERNSDAFVRLGLVKCDGMDLPRPFVIRESTHRIHNALTPAKLARLLQPGQQLLDLACGSGEMLCTWARDHDVMGFGASRCRAAIAAALLCYVEILITKIMRRAG